MRRFLSLLSFSTDFLSPTFPVIVVRHFVERFEAYGKVAVGLHGGVRETRWIAGDMKEHHVVSLKIVRAWIKEDSAGPEQAWIEHFEHV